MWLNLLPRGFIAPVFLALNLCLLCGCYGLPVVFPSLTQTTGFAYVTNGSKIVPIPSTLEPLLCSRDGETVSFQPATKRCTDVIIFTSDSTLTLEFLNLSSNGVAQPFISVPQTRTSEPGIVEETWKPDVGNALLSGKTTNVESANAKLFSVDEVNAGCFAKNSEYTNLYQNSDDDGDDDEDDDDAPVTSTMASSQPHMPQSPSPSVQGPTKAGGQTSPAVSLPPKAGKSTAHEIDDAVREANKTSGFLDSSGAIADDSEFVREMELSNLPERKLVLFVAFFGHNSNRSLLIYFDPSPVSANITQLSQGTEKQDKVDYTFQVKFSTRMRSKPDPKLLSCPSVTDPLNDLLSV